MSRARVCVVFVAGEHLYVSLMHVCHLCLASVCMSRVHVCVIFVAGERLYVSLTHVCGLCCWGASV